MMSQKKFSLHKTLIPQYFYDAGSSYNRSQAMAGEVRGAAGKKQYPCTGILIINLAFPRILL